MDTLLAFQMLPRSIFIYVTGSLVPFEDDLSANCVYSPFFATLKCTILINC